MKAQSFGISRFNQEVKAQCISPNFFVLLTVRATQQMLLPFLEFISRKSV
jgi:hypothetical protein